MTATERSVRLFLFGLFVGALGCQAREPDERLAQATDHDPPSLETPAPVRGAPTDPAIPARPAPSADPGPSAAEGTPCEKAHATFTRIDAALRARGKAPERALPPRAEFVAACRELPLALRRCLDMTYYIKEHTACSALIDGLSPEVRAKLDGLRELGSVEGKKVPRQ